MPTSDTAESYAATHGPKITDSIWDAVRIVVELRAAFDAGSAHALATITPRTISTAADLDALPKGSVVQDRTGSFWIKLIEGAEECWMLDVGSDYEEAAWLVQFGPFTLLVPATAAPEPVRLTDPDDPRIKPGARVRITQDREVAERDCWTDDEVGGRYLKWLFDKPRDVYLIAEAPDSEVDRRKVLRQALADARLDDWTDAELDDILFGLAARNYPIVKVER